METIEVVGIVSFAKGKLMMGNSIFVLSLIANNYFQFDPGQNPVLTKQSSK